MKCDTKYNKINTLVIYKAWHKYTINIYTVTHIEQTHTQTYSQAPLCIVSIVWEIWVVDVLKSCTK